MPVRLIDIEQVIVAPPSEDDVVSPSSWFDSPGDLELEIGCGKGGFLLVRAEQHPDKHFLGIEWANKIFRYTADRVARRGLRNVRVMRTDARRFVEVHLPPDCLTAIHLYHPDPWPKKRHHKRRLVQPAFVDAVVRTLTPGGRWAIQTDHQGYFEHIREFVLPHPRLVETLFDQPDFGVVENATHTNYEIKYLKEGREIYRLAVVKQP